MLWRKNKNGGQIPHFFREVEVASESGPLFSILLRVPYNGRYLKLKTRLCSDDIERNLVLSFR